MKRILYVCSYIFWIKQSASVSSHINNQSRSVKDKIIIII